MERLPEATKRPFRRSAIALTAGLTLAGLFSALPVGEAPAQSSYTAIKIDGVDELTTTRSMAADFDRVLRNSASAQYVVINPNNGPESLDGNDPSGSGYAPPNPNIEDFVLRAKRLSGSGRVLGWLPAATGASRAVDYRDGYGTDGVMLADYDCAGAASASDTIKASWPTAVVVTANASCAGGISPSAIVGPSSLGEGSQDPYGGYPTSPSLKLGIPAYFTDSASWDRLLAGIGDVGAVVVDWSSIGALRSKIQAARAGGAKVYAYVPTGYITQTGGVTNAANAGTRITAALADADINGVFLDEVRSGYSTRARTYYSPFYNQAVAAGKELIYNSGQTAGSGFLSITSKSINYEGKFATFGNWPASEWGRSASSDRIWQIIHTTDSADIVRAANLAKSRNASLVWISPNDQFNLFPDAQYYAAVRTAVRDSVASPGTPVVTSPSASSSGATQGTSAPIVYQSIVETTTTTTTTTTTAAPTITPVASPVATSSGSTSTGSSSTGSNSASSISTSTAPETASTTKLLPVVTTTTTTLPVAAPQAVPVATASPVRGSSSTSPKVSTKRPAKAKYRFVRVRYCRNVKVRTKSGRFTTRRKCKYIYKRVRVSVKK